MRDSKTDTPEKDRQTPSNQFMTLDDKLAQLQYLLEQMGEVMVAYSGGVDSTLLLKVAKDCLPDKTLAVTAVSEISPSQERRDAIETARSLGVEHLLVETHELDLAGFSTNHPDRCYVCKKARFSRLLELARQRGIRWVVDGENQDDELDFRPGSVAARSLGIRSPLREAGLSKREIRELSKRMGLATWNKPSQACLASRVPYYSPITAEKLEQIDAGETFLRQLGFDPQLRVRHYGDMARLELNCDDFPKVISNGMRQRIVAHFNRLGFCYVAVDLSGYEMGNLNRALARSIEGVMNGSETNQGSAE